MAQNETDVEVTLQEDQFSNGDWSDEDYEDQENLPPPSSEIKKSNIRESNLDPITEESRTNYSQYSHQHTDDKDSDEITERTQAPTPATGTNKTRKHSISFGSDSFGKLDDVEKVFQAEEEDCHERNLFRPRPDVTHESDAVHSWEPTPASLEITKVSLPSQTSKPLTSTPISGRFPRSFNAGVSAIQEISQNNYRNESSTFSNTKVNWLIKDVKMEQSSIDIARNFVQKAPPSYARRLPKTSILLSDLKKNRDAKNSSVIKSSKLSTSNPNKPEFRQTNFFHPTLAPLHERDSISSRPSSSTNSAVEIAIKPAPLSHWGFVAVGEEVESKIYVRNELSHLIEIIPSLRNRNSTNSFKLTTTHAVQIHPHCSHEFSVVFAPTKCVKFHDYVQFYVASSGKTYKHKLYGYGGTCDVKINEKRYLSYFPVYGVYRFAPPNLLTFEFEVENYGDRTAFVHVAAFDANGLEARSVTVSPQSFCLESKNPESSSKAVVTVKVPENYINELRRMSMQSLASASSVKKNHVFTLKVIFGDERLRQRAKVYCDEVNRHEIFQGFSLTRTSFNMNETLTRTVDCEGTSIQDLEMLKCQTRALTILVGDDQTSKPSTKSLSSRPSSSVSHRDLVDNGYYFPECNNECDSKFLSVAYSDRTFMK